MLAALLSQQRAHSVYWRCSRAAGVDYAGSSCRAAAAGAAGADVP